MDHSDTTHPAEHGADPSADAQGAPRVPFGPTHLGVLAILAGVFALLARALDGAVPMLIAGVVAALVPRRHGWSVRAPLAVMAALLALFVTRNWPGVSGVAG